MELYKKYRPKDWSDVLGQNAALQMLEVMVEDKEVPQAILFTGPSGCGKTTLARILQRKLKTAKTDRISINANRVKGIDMVRDIANTIGLAPLKKSRVYIIDEAHKLTPDAQGAFLDLLEDGIPKDAYIILCTTDPHRLLRTIRSRCTEISIDSLSNQHLNTLLKKTIKQESASLTDPVIKKIIEVSEGSGRKAMVLLNQVLKLKKEKEQIELVKKSRYEQDAFKIAQALFRRGGIKWKDMVEVLNSCVLKDPEGIRWMILAYATKVLHSGSSLAADVIEVFQDNWFDCKEAGLWLACYRIIGNRK